MKLVYNWSWHLSTHCLVHQECLHHSYVCIIFVEIINKILHISVSIIIVFPFINELYFPNVEITVCHLEKLLCCYRKWVSSSNQVGDGNRFDAFCIYCHFAPYYDNQNYIKLMAHKIQLEVAATITKAIIIQILNNDSFSNHNVTVTNRGKDSVYKMTIKFHFNPNFHNI